MKPSEALLEAVDHLKDAGCCCGAIGDVTFSDERYSTLGWHKCALLERKAREYFNLFKPDDASIFDFWFGLSGENLELRALALTFAAAIAESEGN